MALVEPTSRMKIGLERDHAFEIGSVTPPGDAADFRPSANIRQHVGAFLRTVGTWPAEQQIRRERVEQNCSRRARRETRARLSRVSAIRGRSHRSPVAARATRGKSIAAPALTTKALRLMGMLILVSDRGKAGHGTFSLWRDSSPPPPSRWWP